MTEQAALQILDQAAAQAPLTRQDHALVQQAVAVLAESIRREALREQEQGV